MTAAQEALLRRVDRKLSLLLQEQGKEKPAKWVDVTTVTKMTGWGAEEMRQAREKELIVFRIIGEGLTKRKYQYDLNSIHERFLKTTA